MRSIIQSNLFCFLFYVGLFSRVHAAISCKNIKNEDVDWWQGYKMSHKAENLNDTGLTMATWQDDSTFWTWQNLGKAKQSNLYYTTAQMPYIVGENESDDIGWVVYNDQLCSGMAKYKGDYDAYKTNCNENQGSKYGHMKGFLIFDKSGGVWLTHSTPGFPLNSKQAKALGGWNYNKDTYAQGFFCMTLGPDEINKVADNMKIGMPYIQEYHYPNKLKSEYKNIGSWLKTKYTKTPSSTDRHWSILKTKKGKEITAFIKSQKSHLQLWEDFVAPGLKLPMRVESWCREGFGDDDMKCLPSTCKAKYPVMQIKTMKFKGFEMDHEQHSIESHVKLGISTKPDSPYVCFGDINRQNDQKYRGGGAACIADDFAWKILNLAIEEIYSCPGY